MTFRDQKARLLSMIALLTLPASGCSTVAERGWIGGELVSVLSSPEGRFAITPSSVVGLPADLDHEGGLLIVGLSERTPLAHAGLQVGDLLVRMNGLPVPGDPLEFRRTIESLPIGSEVTLSAWRSGDLKEAVTTIGKEVVASHVTFGLYLGASAHVDLWPLDDGVSIAGLVAVRTDNFRWELHGPKRRYLEEATQNPNPSMPRQEVLEVKVFPLFWHRHLSVLKQEAVP